MGSRRGFIEQICHAALLGMANAMSFRREQGALFSDVELRMRAVLSFDFVKAARNPS